MGESAVASSTTGLALSAARAARGRRLPAPGDAAERESTAQPALSGDANFVRRSSRALDASLKWPGDLLRMSRPDDTAEREDHRVADSVITVDQTGNVSNPTDPAEIEASDIAEKVLANGSPHSPGLDAPPQPGRLDERTRTWLEGELGHDLSRVELHTDRRSARASEQIDAVAFTVGSDIHFDASTSSRGLREQAKILVHEAVHVVQQAPGALRSSSPAPHRPTERVELHQARQAHTIDVDIIRSLDEYDYGGSERVRVGDAASSRLLLDIVDDGGAISFHTFNLETGEAEVLSLQEWLFFKGAAIIGGSNAGVTALGRLLPASRWRQLWPNPVPELLRMYEANQLPASDQAILTTYRGMVRSEARATLDRNEALLDEILGAPDRLIRLEEFAQGLREASLIRDALVTRREELAHSLAAQHSFTFGLPHAGTGPDVAQQLRIHRELGMVEETLRTWMLSFPLLTRLQTSAITTGSVEARLREIKGNISSVRADLNRGQLDPMALGPPRSRVAGQIGPRASAVVEAEDTSRGRIAMATGLLALAGSLALLFVPGGLFVDAVIGFAMAGSAIETAEAVGRAANTGLHVDDGLMSQSQANWASFGAVISVVLALLGPAAAGFRVLRVARTARILGEALPELSSAERTAAARALASEPAAVATLAGTTRAGVSDASIGARISAAIRRSGDNPAALRAGLLEVAQVAAIPRRVAASDLYSPLRQITDGSDIAGIATQTGLPRAQVAAAKQHLMLDEHIMVDAQGALFRGRFEPYEEVATLWSRAARGERLSAADRDFLTRLIRHEQVEGSVLAESALSLEQAFLRGQLEGRLRTYLQGRGWNAASIERMMALEPRPVTPYRYAHIVAATSGAPNP